MLALAGIEKRFGALSALAGIDLEVAAGEVPGIIGPNGSGKTTLLNAVTGVYPPSAGRISFQGTDSTGWKGHRIARLGVARTFQNIRLFPTMTVFQNVWAAQHRLVSGGLLGLLRNRPAREGADTRRVEEVLEQVGLVRDREILARHLPLPARRRLEVARALIVDARLVLLDEPSLGLSPKLAAGVFDLIRRLRDGGLTVLLVEQNVRRTLALADRACVLEGGRIALQGAAAELMSDDRLVSNYLGVPSPASSTST